MNRSNMGVENFNTSIVEIFGVILPDAKEILARFPLAGTLELLFYYLYLYKGGSPLDAPYLGIIFTKTIEIFTSLTSNIMFFMSLEVFVEFFDKSETLSLSIY